MARLAIKKHETRGNEVIEILEMLGGENSIQYCGDDYCSAYSIEGREIVIYELESVKSDDFIVFTLEEFLEKFPYKVGDKVSYVKYNDEYPSVYTIQKIRWTGATIEYLLGSSGFSALTKDLQPYKEETMEDKLIPRIDLAGYCKDKYIIDLGNYEIKKENGKTYAVRKQPKYPKTIEECAKVLSTLPHTRNGVSGYSSHALWKFQQLLICRDAYWKIAGDEMGLGKSWKPDWNKSDQFKNVLICSSNNIIKYAYAALNTILAFPTEEMRDAFYENFEDLIEECKEFL